MNLVGNAIAYLFKSLHKPIYDGCRSSIVGEKMPQTSCRDRNRHVFL